MKKYELRITSEFKRKSQKWLKNNPNLSNKWAAVLKQLTDNLFFPNLKTHTVQVINYGLRYSSSVSSDMRIIWDFDGEAIILLITIGGHSGKNKVYK